ncbi:MAG: hypothetical protein QW666_01445 [Candidatus Woesearchaeota archaeon]
MSFKDVKEVIKKCKENLKIIDNYYIPYKAKIETVKNFFKEVIAFEFQHIKILDAKQESVFTILYNNIIFQCKRFIETENPEVLDAKSLLLLIMDVENYIEGIEKLKWKAGRKISRAEIVNLRGIFRRKLHTLYDEKKKRPVRGTRVRVEVVGSISKGFSDWKLINGGDIPRPDFKPSDYDLVHKMLSEETLQKLDKDLNLPWELKPLMSDVDILIMNEVIFDSIDPYYKKTEWSFKLGEKYPTGAGGSRIIEKLHQSLLYAKIGGIASRWVNYIILRDEKGYANYMASRKKIIEMAEKKAGKKIELRDVLILDEIIQ